MGSWETISGSEAVNMAEGICRPGTFTAAVAAWCGGESPPDHAKLNGNLRCGSCGKCTDFSFGSQANCMGSRQVPCAGFATTYTVYVVGKDIGSRRCHVVLASVYSHVRGSPLMLPHVEITEVHVPPLFDLCALADRNKIKAFLDAGGDINAYDYTDATLLYYAVLWDDVDGVRHLLEFGANPNKPAVSDSPELPVDVARRTGKPHARQIEALLQGGV